MTKCLRFQFLKRLEFLIQHTGVTRFLRENKNPKKAMVKWETPETPE